MYSTLRGLPESSPVLIGRDHHQPHPRRGQLHLHIGAPEPHPTPITHPAQLTRTLVQQGQDNTGLGVLISMKRNS